MEEEGAARKRRLVRWWASAVPWVKRSWSPPPRCSRQRHHRLWPTMADAEARVPGAPMPPTHEAVSLHARVSAGAAAAVAPAARGRDGPVGIDKWGREEGQWLRRARVALACGWDGSESTAVALCRVRRVCASCVLPVCGAKPRTRAAERAEARVCPVWHITHTHTHNMLNKGRT